MPFALGRRYSRDKIFEVLGGNMQAFLPMKDGRVLYGAFKRQLDPEAPHVVLPGDGPEIVKSARTFAQQADPVPIFLKHEANQWEYVGLYRVHSFSENPAIIARYASRAARTDKVTMVLFLEYAGDKAPAA